MLASQTAKESWSLLPLRLMIGFGFAAHGYAKLHRGPNKFAGILASVGVPQPHLTAWVTALLEFFGGIGLMAGAFVLPFTVPLAVIMLTALFTVHLRYGFSSVVLKGVTPSGAQFGPVGYELNLLYITGLLTFAISGAGALSVDEWLHRKLRCGCYTIKSSSGIEIGSKCTSQGDYKIALAELKDIPYLSSVEKAAATLLKGHAPASVLEDTTDDAEFHDAQMDGRLWVARSNDLPVAFAHAEMLEPTSAHLKELNVHPEHLRRGLGSRLVMAVCAWARVIGCRSLTLTTFREVPFNMPFYAQLGFEVIPPEELSPTLRSIIQEEGRRGLDPSRRVAMRYRFAERGGNETVCGLQRRASKQSIATPCGSPLEKGN